MNAFATTDVGIERNVNQDYVYAKLDDIGCLPNLFIVADGMGGHKAGDTASRYTVETLVELLKESEGKDPLATIDNNIKLVNTLLLRKAGESEEYNGMGTTLVVASIFDNTLRAHEKKNVITRAIGGYDTVEAEMFSVDLKKEDMILMCSDGLTNMLEDQEIFHIIKSSHDIREAAERLVSRANDNGGRDNISVILIEP